MTFDEVMRAWSWKPIPNCPGRFILRQAKGNLTQQDILGPNIEMVEYRVPAATDPVIVTAIEDGGLISYRKPGGAFLHTLNTREGLDRKLRQLGIKTP